MITKEQLSLLSHGGFTVMITHADSGLWTINRSNRNAYAKGRRTQKSSSYCFSLAVEDLVKQAERSLVDATSQGVH